MAYMLYLQDNDDRLPYKIDDQKGSLYNCIVMKSGWPGRMWTYFNNEELCYCPADPSVQRVKYDNWTSGTICNVAYRRVLARASAAGQKASSVRRATGVVVISDRKSYHEKFILDMDSAVYANVYSLKLTSVFLDGHAGTWNLLPLFGTYSAESFHYKNGTWTTWCTSVVEGHDVN